MGALAAVAAAAVVGFSQHAGKLVVQAPAYRVVLSAQTGRIVEVDDARGRKLLGGGYGCQWWVNPDHRATSLSGCSFRSTYRWRAGTLTLTYGKAAVVTLRAHAAYFDLQLQLRSSGVVRDEVRFPAGIVGDTRTVQYGYSPNVLPGVRLKPAFFSTVANPVQIYPSRWAFADYLALDANGGHVAMYTVNRGPIASALVGFLHLGAGSPCSGLSYCLFHQFETWVQPGATWTSPTIRIRVGQTAQQSILAYRDDNGIGSYPSLADKLGPLFGTLARAPLVKADVAKIQEPYTSWPLAELPSPILLHPVAYQVGGHDVGDPDFLPGDPRWGSLATLIADAHARGDAVMPYDNLSWWDPSSPTMQRTTAGAVGALDSTGAPQTIEYGVHTGLIVSPWAPFVQQRATQELDAWRALGADCVFLDQIGARPWLYDFNPAAASPLAYDDGWLSLLAPYRQSCLMAEDGWDRLAATVVGFHGGLLMMQRELGAVDHYFGAGNWEPYPLATWLVHDKVLMYQHDLYPGTIGADDEVLTWNAAFGLVASVEWQPGNETDPRLVLAARLQEVLGPHFAGVPLASFTDLAPGVTRSVFGDLTVVANLSSEPYQGVAADGFQARAPGVTVQAYRGGHWVLTTQSGGATVVEQPVGGDFDVTVPLAASRVVAEPSGMSVPFTRTAGGTTFTYAAGVQSYRVEP
jgi:Domain of unknown function (DUF6259)